ncbi:hypothetical protein, partial [Streptomyces sp. CA-106110]|uniref:hypothetical protein n=1 Tax=Streptomyces sp. CA-106110 TaxID=3240044 RepID=UPI003D8F2EFE
RTKYRFAREHDAPALRAGSTALLRTAVDTPSLRDGVSDRSAIQAQEFAPRIPEKRLAGPAWSSHFFFPLA